MSKAELVALERALIRAKASQDVEAIRELIPQVNAARRAYTGSVALAQADARYEKLTPRRRVELAIFGE